VPYKHILCTAFVVGEFRWVNGCVSVWEKQFVLTLCASDDHVVHRGEWSEEGAIPTRHRR